MRRHRARRSALYRRRASIRASHVAAVRHAWRQAFSEEEARRRPTARCAVVVWGLALAASRRLCSHSTSVGIRGSSDGIRAWRARRTLSQYSSRGSAPAASCQPLSRGEGCLSRPSSGSRPLNTSGLWSVRIRRPGLTTAASPITQAEASTKSIWALWRSRRRPRASGRRRRCHVHSSRGRRRPKVLRARKWNSQRNASNALRLAVSRIQRPRAGYTASPEIHAV